MAVQFAVERVSSLVWNTHIKLVGLVFLLMVLLKCGSKPEYEASAYHPAIATEVHHAEQKNQEYKVDEELLKKQAYEEEKKRVERLDEGAITLIRCREEDCNEAKIEAAILLLGDMESVGKLLGPPLHSKYYYKSKAGNNTYSVPTKFRKYTVTVHYAEKNDYYTGYRKQSKVERCEVSRYNVF